MQDAGEGIKEEDGGVVDSPGHSETMHQHLHGVDGAANENRKTNSLRRNTSRNTSGETQETNPTSADKSDRQVEAQGGLREFKGQ